MIISTKKSFYNHEHLVVPIGRKMYDIGKICLLKQKDIRSVQTHLHLEGMFRSKANIFYINCKIPLYERTLKPNSVIFKKPS